MNYKSPAQNVGFHQIRHLRQYYSPKDKLFDDATQLPQFFLTNLVDDSRVVKYFHQDPQANIRIFYYQYLKLCFEIDNVDYESYIEKIYELIRTEGFEFYFKTDDPQKQTKNAQFKSLLIDFFEIMNSGSLTIEAVLTQYPILEQVFTNFFRTVVMLASVATQFNSYIQKNELFDFLSSFFSVDISSYDRCLKFVESDIFVYEFDQENIYMAFIKDQEQQIMQSFQAITSQNNLEQQCPRILQPIAQIISQNDNPISESQRLSERSQQNEQSNAKFFEEQIRSKESIAPSSTILGGASLKPRAKTVIRESYIQAQFADYTSYVNISSFGKNVTNQHLGKQVSQTIQLNTAYQSQQKNNNQIQQPKKLQDHERQLKRVLSAGNSNFKVNYNDNGGYLENTDEFQVVVRQEKRNVLGKVSSHPNLLVSSNNNPQFGQSCYDHEIEQKIVPDASQLVQNSDPQDSKDNQRQLKKNPSYKVYEEPTKDPGFGIQRQQKSKESSQSQTIYQLHTFRQVQPMNDSKKSSTHMLYNPIFSSIQNSLSNSRHNIESKKTISQAQSRHKEQLFHKPEVSFPTLSNNNNALNSNVRLASSSNSQKSDFLQPLVQGFNVGGTQAQNYQPSSLKLNVTKQFTNSFVMKQMKQPYKSNVYQTRDRARQFRRNIYKQINNYHLGTNQYNSNNNSRLWTNLGNVPEQIEVKNSSSYSNFGQSNPVINTSKNTKYSEYFDMVKPLSNVDRKQINAYKYQQKLHSPASSNMAQPSQKGGLHSHKLSKIIHETYKSINVESNTSSPYKQHHNGKQPQPRKKQIRQQQISQNSKQRPKGHQHTPSAFKQMGCKQVQSKNNSNRGIVFNPSPIPYVKYDQAKVSPYQTTRVTAQQIGGSGYKPSYQISGSRQSYQSAAIRTPYQSPSNYVASRPSYQSPSNLQNKPQTQGYQSPSNFQNKPQTQGYQSPSNLQNKPQTQGYQSPSKFQNKPQSPEYQANQNRAISGYIPFDQRK